MNRAEIHFRERLRGLRIPQRTVTLIGHPDAGKTTLLAATGAEMPDDRPVEFDGMGGSDA